MAFEIKFKDGKARAGVLKTKSGDVETPFFMPVATKTSVKHISPEDLQSMGAHAIISNALILSLVPGENVVDKFGGIGKFMKYHGVNFTDSGGFQMYSKQIYIGSNDNEVLFRNPMNGDKIKMTPEMDMDLQLKLNSDVAMCLDSMPLIEESKESIQEAIRKTLMWAKRCKLHHDKMQKNRKENERQLLFGIIQGGIHPELREYCAKEMIKIDFDGFSIGGLALGEPKEDEYKMIEIVKSIAPEEKPIYLMGAGNPVELLEAISRGVDMFDSRFPTRNARNGSIFTSNGLLRLMNSRYRDDTSPIDENCECFVCKKYSKAYVRHLLANREGVGYRLASYHNLFFLQDLMRKARKAIEEGKFNELLEKYRNSYKV